ncbi:GNAT family N-acetyltransferase [Vibrio genomosp. F6]|uniref:GNAT family N-acetyltransferase n=1 Tax=Vibrio genomosp. F6 TaxID=723172 RepID=UPI0010BD5E39|nr:GNAT family protein [Vibrio genomosp. F6]TKF24053.1 GNAT family N-acetyltransferase [Vibrio genomosp. F6]
MSPDFQIITQRLCLRLIDHSEEEIFATEVAHSPSLHQWIDWCTPHFSVEDSRQFLLATRLNWAKATSFGFGIFRKSDQTLIGMVAINEFYHTFNMASMGYWVLDKHQRHGYAKEALNALTEFCFAKLMLTRLEIVCDPDNMPSQALIEQCGGIKEGVARNRFLFNGKPKAGVVYSIIPER